MAELDAAIGSSARVPLLGGQVPSARTQVPRVPVLLVISSLEHGGAQRQVVQLANHLDPARFEVHVCALSQVVPLASGLRQPEVQFHVVEKRGRFDVNTALRLARLMRELDVRIVHAFLFDAEMAVRLAAKLAHVPVVVSSERNSDYRRPALHAVCLRLTRSWFDVMIANSSAGKRFNQRTLGLAEARIEVVPNGVDPREFSTGSSATARQALGIDPEGPVVGMAASFKRQKNHGDFFRMARQVLNQFPSCRFLCVGEPLRDNQQGASDYHRAMLALLRELGLQDKCLLLGARDDMPVVYRACDVTVLTSTREGMPNVLLESMACGVPVVATDVADNALLVPQGEVGFVVALGDVDALSTRVCDLLAQPLRRQSLGQAARQWVKREFTNEVLAQRTAAVYLRALRRKAPESLLSNVAAAPRGG